MFTKSFFGGFWWFSGAGRVCAGGGFGGGGVGLSWGFAAVVGERSRVLRWWIVGWMGVCVEGDFEVEVACCVFGL